MIKKAIKILGLTYALSVIANFGGHAMNGAYISYLINHSNKGEYNQLEDKYDRVFEEFKSSKVLIPGSIIWRWVGENSKDLTKKLD